MEEVKDTNKKTVLLVEDDPVILRMYSTKLTNDGFNVMDASDGVMGLEKAEKEKIDIMVLDLMMPRMSGIEVLESLTKNGKSLKMPVIVLTNLTEKEEQEKALQMGVKEFLIKADLLPSDLVKTLNKYL
jgi:DNA-binding response OmpR family regulator